MELPSTLASCHELIRQLLATIQVLESQLAGLQGKVEELERRSNQTSRNSHRPPSTDGPKKSPALPRPRGKNRGGQPGHQGDTLLMVETPDEQVVLLPERCCGCSAKLGADREGYELVSCRQVVELPELRLRTIEYQSYGCACRRCGSYTQAEFPRTVSGRIQYGSSVKALVTLLHQHGCLSVEKIQCLFEDLFSWRLNGATILRTQHTAYEQLAQEEQYIKEQLSRSKVVHADESGVRVEGSHHWLHNLSNERYTYQFIHAKRGQSAHEPSLSFLDDYQGWLIHDCYPFYFGYQKAQHGVCNAHLLRELNAQVELGRQWAKDFKTLLMDLYHKTEKGTQKLAKKVRKKVLRDYQRILDRAYQEEPPPQSPTTRGRAKNTKGRNLLLRLDKRREAVLAFAWKKCVPFTNNLAERDIRPAKIKWKIAGCLRTLKGAKVYARIHSFISTVRKHQVSPYQQLISIFDGKMPQYRVGGAK